MLKFKTTFVIAISTVLVLTVVATQSAHAQTFTVIHNFTGGQDGWNPRAGVTIDEAGNLYGTTYYGGFLGAVYQLKHKGSGWTVNPLYSFTGKDGAYPEARVIFGLNGTLYGTTSDGGSYGSGMVFNLRPSASACKSALCPWTEAVLYDFKGGADGKRPNYGDLIFDQKGTIYGTTYEGGAYGAGTVYELTPSGGGSYTESVLYSFSGGSDGDNPSGGVILDSAGNLYGTTFRGGIHKLGTVFQLVQSTGWTENILHSLDGRNDGGYPGAGLIFDESGDLYGATSNGGTGGGGTVFELSPSGSGWTYARICGLTGLEQCGPWGTLVMDGAGNLDGTTNCDGKYGWGSVFKLTPSGGSWTYTSLHDFTGGSDGAYPFGSVLLHPNGKLYGTAAGGGLQQCTGGCGVVWEITP